MYKSSLFIDEENLSGEYQYESDKIYENKLYSGNNLNLDVVDNNIIFSFKYNKELINFILYKYNKDIKENFFYYIEKLHNYKEEALELKKLELEKELENHSFHIEEEKDIINYEELENQIALSYMYNIPITYFDKIQHYYLNINKYNLIIFFNVFFKYYGKLLRFIYIRFYDLIPYISFEIKNKYFYININNNYNINHKLLIVFYTHKLNLIDYILIYKKTNETFYKNDKNNEYKKYDKYDLVEVWKKFDINKNIYYCKQLYFYPVNSSFSLSYTPNFFIF